MTIRLGKRSRTPETSKEEIKVNDCETHGYMYTRKADSGNKTVTSPVEFVSEKEAASDV